MQVFSAVRGKFPALMQVSSAVRAVEHVALVALHLQQVSSSQKPGYSSHKLLPPPLP
jgi:hypothetical protein